ncbi:hypothetical protein [Bartonella jaculi]|uniref:Uncharacterized protein n=1 Tax=Bartonella jaculi TaxID=686226 RepID=A0ABP9NAC6_9HYPH
MAIGGAEINVANKSGESRIIFGVKAAENDDEAVNKKQLDGEIADITDSIKVIKEANSFAVLYDKKSNGSVNHNSITLGGNKSTGPVAFLNVKDGDNLQGSHDAIKMAAKLIKYPKILHKLFWWRCLVRE